MVLKYTALVIRLCFTNKGPWSRRKYLIIGDGKKVDIEFFGCIDVVILCEEDVEVTLRMWRICVEYLLTFARLT